MPMDELIRGIELAEAEDIQDLLDAVIHRYQELYPHHSIMYLSLPKNDMHAQKEQFEAVWKLLHNHG